MTTYEDSLSLKSTLEDAILELSGNKSMSKEFLEDNDADYPDWQSFCSKSSVTINSIRITHVRKKW